jgi:hypothetical protein
MLKVVFNEDGSINELIVMESINQGSNNVNKVFASILGISNENYTCVGEFELPSGELEELSGERDSQEVGQSTLDGYTISLAESVTRQAGNLKLNLKLIDLQDNVLCTYQVTLKVNKTGYEPNTTHITEAQYNALLQSLNGYAINLDFQNFYTKTEIDTKFEDYYTIAQVQANYYDKTYIDTYLYTRAAVDLLLAEKQKALTAGAGITILEDGTISATTALSLAYYPSLSDLPSVGALNTIYMIPSSQQVEPSNNYDEYIWDTNNTRYEKIGTISTQVDLSNYYNKQEVNALLDNKVNKDAIATSSTLGLVKSATTGTTSDRYYNVEVNNDGTMKVNVPWEKTHRHTVSIIDTGTSTNYGRVRFYNFSTNSIYSGSVLEIAIKGLSINAQYSPQATGDVWYKVLYLDYSISGSGATRIESVVIKYFDYNDDSIKTANIGILAEDIEYSDTVD